MLKKIPFHSLLFCIFPIMYLYSINIEEVKFPDTILPILINLTIGAISFFIIYLITKNLCQAGTETSIILLLYSSFGHITFLLVRNNYFVHDPRPVIAIFVAVFILLTWANFRVIKNFKPITEYLNFVSIVLVLVSAFSITNFWLRTQNTLPSPPITKVKEPLDTPDIYYLILDGYGGSEMLSDVYDFNNQSFLNSLEKKGFYIANESKSNYVRTYLSLGSTLNVDYYTNDNWMSEHVRNHASAFYDLISNNLVKNQLEEFGYEIYVFPNIYNTTNWVNGNFVGKIPIGTFFLWEYLRTTILVLFWNSLPYEVYQTQVLNSLHLLEKSAEIEGPKLIFYHVLMPHPPFVFDENGNSSYSNDTFRLMDGNDQDLPPNIYQAKYTAQLKFINSKIDQVVTSILSNSKEEPIIIIQGDHGPGSYLDYYDFEGNKCLYERFSILNAYYFPDRNYEDLYRGISPVNSFRIVFDQYFGLPYDILDDKSYYSTSEYLDDFIEVTNLLDVQHCKPNFDNSD